MDLPDQAFSDTFAQDTDFLVSSGVDITDTGAAQPYVWEVQDLATFEGGVITIDGQDIAGVTQDSLRGQIGVVTQVMDQVRLAGIEGVSISAEPPGG